MKKLLASITVSVMLAGCAVGGGSVSTTANSGGGSVATSIVDSPARQVFAAKQTYQAALTVAVAYKALPHCGLNPKPLLCSDKAVVTTIQKADVVVYEALNSAERVVRSETSSGDNLHTAVIWAQEAINAFSRVTSVLKVK